ncbi:molybdopterin-dependent oxidoreductase (plasmid) [Sphingobium sp. JS3065]|uniref:molybdopterin-containing oxidoreductase family protein n=1 Tax=Sphingobium sp. JS3065 TaxID=2970925 RepID=UPI0022643745|nr:molybdopterin-dependent oxidoreductase [Sphingobium sp. JS3065]UZW58292.1 molybdopterin-dependent oxidoreductase [Sphingobium sp. JS3065]
MAEVLSMCRVCTAICGMVVSLDDEGQVTAVRGDRDHPASRGYNCSIGLQAPALMNDPERLLHPMKRMADGGFQPIDLDTALGEIADRLRAIVEESGPDSVGLFKGTQTYQNATASQMLVDWMAALGSQNYFTTLTIDQSCHAVTKARMGAWNAGKHRLEDSDVALLIGTNPLVSKGGYSLLDYDPSRRLKAARQRGLKLIVIDPRRTETAAQADLFLQPVPGQDPLILAGLIRVILTHGWEDRPFCVDYVDGLDALRAAVDPFDEHRVATQAGISAADLVSAARMFAHDANRGIAIIGTGGSMAPRSNLADHLVETLNGLCGRLLREGEAVLSPGVLSPMRRFTADVIPGDRGWENGPKSSTGHGAIFGQRMSGILADEMLLHGPGRIRALIVNGGNPAVALPDQAKAVAGLKALDLLVAVDPYMTATTMLCDYIIPPKMVYERTDIARPPHMELALSGSQFNQYIPAVASAPPGSQVIDDWHFYWALAKRLGLRLVYAGAELDLDQPPPSTDDLLDIQFRDSRVPLDTLRQFPRGHVFDEHDFVVEARETTHRFAIAPPDIVEELAEVADLIETSVTDVAYPYLLIVRRVRTTYNSVGRTLPETRKRDAQNPLYVHPDDLADLGIERGGRIALTSATGSIGVIVAADPSLRRGSVAMTHCRGLLPDDDYSQHGVSTSQLVSTTTNVEAINAMPAMTAIPVRIDPC